MKKLSKRGETVLLICLCVALLASSAMTAIVGVKLFSTKGSSSKPTSAIKDVTLADIGKLDKDFSKVDFSKKISKGILKISDCGAKANELIDYGPLIQAALRTVAQNPETVLTFDKGVYYVGPESKEAQHVFNVSEYEVDGLHIDGNGCTFMMTDSFIGCFNLRNCDNVVIEDMYFDCLNNPWVQGTVTAYDKENLTMIVELDGNSEMLDDPRMAERTETRTGMVRDKDNPYLLKPECNNFFHFSGWSKVRKDTYKITLTPNSKYLVGDYIEVQDKIILNNRADHSTFTFDTLGAGNITLKDITIYNTSGGGIVGAKNKGDIVLDNFKMTIRKDSKNWICGNADAVHIQGCTGSVTMTNCEFSYLSDDAINLYQWYSDTSNVVSSSVIDVIPGGTSFSKGDTIEIVDQASGKLLGSPVIKEVQVVDGKRIDTLARLVLETPIPELQTGPCKEKYYVYSIENCFPNSKVKNCTFSNIRGRGMLLRTVDMIVEDNTFKNISNHALEAWFNGDEGFEVRNLIFRNNTIKNVSYLDVEADSTGAGAISISIYGDEGQSKYISHNKILIENNDITDYHGCAIGIGNARGVTVKGNTFSIKKPLKDYKVENALYFNYCDGVTVSGNTFNDNREKITAAIRYDADTVNGITFDGNKFKCPANKQIVKD